MKIKKFMIAIGCLAMCGLAAVGTYALLHDKTNEVINQFTGTENLSVEVIETKWENKASSYLPGDVYTKNPTLVNKSSKNKIYGALKVQFKQNDTIYSYEEFAKKFATVDKFNDNWEHIGQAKDGSELYVCKYVIAESTTVTPELFTQVKINEDIAFVNGKLPNIEITVKGYGIQELLTYDQAKEELEKFMND